MTLYCGTLWWHPAESNLLQVKLDEGSAVDHWVICEGTCTFRGHARAISPPHMPSHISWSHVVADNSTVKGDSTRSGRRRNAIQRDATLLSLSLAPDDVFVFCDLDEIIHHCDWPLLVDAALEDGYVTLSMRNYYGKINLLAPKRWNAVFAVSGNFLNEHPRLTANALRYDRRRLCAVPSISIVGKHFGWLYPGEDKSFWDVKSTHNSRANAQATTRARLDRGCTPGGQPLTKVPVDLTYPCKMRNDVTTWWRYMA